MLRALFTLLLAMSTSGAIAQAAKVREVTLPLSRMLEINGGLAALDKYDRVVREGERERVVQDVYKFEPGLRIVIMKNMSALRPIVEGLDKERAAILVELSGGSGELKPGTPEAAAFNLRLRDLAQKPQSASLIPIAEAELKLAVNPIPSSVLLQIEPILDLQ